MAKNKWFRTALVDSAVVGWVLTMLLLLALFMFGAGEILTTPVIILAFGTMFMGVTLGVLITSCYTQVGDYTG